MARRSDAKDQMIAAAARLFRARGYEGVGVAELLEASGAPRGSLYFHFPGGKEEIAVAAMRLAGDIVAGRIAARRARGDPPALFIDLTLKAWADELRSSDYHDGCAVAIIALEMAERSPALRESAASIFAQWEREFAVTALGWGMTQDGAEMFGSAMLGAIEGAIALSRTKRSERPFADAARAMQALAASLLERAEAPTS